MKTRKFNKIALMLFAAILFTTFTINAQDHSKMHDHSKMQKGSKMLKVDAPTVQCNMCKARIEKALKKVDGIISSDVNPEEKYITVNYNPKEITPKEIRKAISDIGYQADDVKANKKAYNKLPGCCKVPSDK